MREGQWEVNPGRAQHRLVNLARHVGGEDHDQPVRSAVEQPVHAIEKTREREPRFGVFRGLRVCNEAAIQLRGAHESLDQSVVGKLSRERYDGDVQTEVRGHSRDSRRLAAARYAVEQDVELVRHGELLVFGLGVEKVVYGVEDRVDLALQYWVCEGRREHTCSPFGPGFGFDGAGRSNV